MPQRKQEIITFKVDSDLWEVLSTVPNRSEFIRSAIMAALEGACPICRGAGTLSVAQRKHWEHFLETHKLEECDDCHAVHIVCANEPAAAPRKRAAHRKHA